jgi:Arc/MetJ family transcription regulator
MATTAEAKASSTEGVIEAACGLLCRLPHMATNLDLDPNLIERTLALSGAPTKKAAVTAALQEFIARREQRRLLELFGKLEWDPGYDYKQERSRD